MHANFYCLLFVQSMVRLRSGMGAYKSDLHFALVWLSWLSVTFEYLGQLPSTCCSGTYIAHYLPP